VHALREYDNGCTTAAVAVSSIQREPELFQWYRHKVVDID